jgi:hypothetical protein
MARRRSRRRSRRPQTGAQLAQIIGLGLILLIILLFRDEVADGAGKFFGVMGSDDVQVDAKEVASGPDAGLVVDDSEQESPGESGGSAKSD